MSLQKLACAVDKHDRKQEITQMLLNILNIELKSTLQRGDQNLEYSYF